MENIHELKAQLASPKDIVIISHRNPDGDAIGSSLGLYHYLLSQGHAVHVVLPSEYPDAFLWMPGIQNIIVFDSDQERTREVCERAQIIFCLDFNSLDRIDKVGEIIQPLNSVKVLIDHHLYPEPFADYVMSDTTASSTAEMVFDFIVLMGHRPDISRATADCVYTGIVTDTGSFKFSTSPKLFRIVAELLELGVDVNEFGRFARDLQQRFRGVLTGTLEPEDAALGKLVSLAGVRNYPSRIKCALLGWHALMQALDEKPAHA